MELWFVWNAWHHPCDGEKWQKEENKIYDCSLLNTDID